MTFPISRRHVFISLFIIYVEQLVWEMKSPKKNMKKVKSVAKGTNSVIRLKCILTRIMLFNPNNKLMR